MERILRHESKKGAVTSANWLHATALLDLLWICYELGNRFAFTVCPGLPPDSLGRLGPIWAQW